MLSNSWCVDASKAIDRAPSAGRMPFSLDRTLVLEGNGGGGRDDRFKRQGARPFRVSGCHPSDRLPHGRHLPHLPVRGRYVARRPQERGHALLRVVGLSDVPPVRRCRRGPPSLRRTSVHTDHARLCPGPRWSHAADGRPHLLRPAAGLPVVPPKLRSETVAGLRRRLVDPRDRGALLRDAARARPGHRKVSDASHRDHRLVGPRRRRRDPLRPDHRWPPHQQRVPVDALGLCPRDVRRHAGGPDPLGGPSHDPRARDRPPRRWIAIGVGIRRCRVGLRILLRHRLGGRAPAVIGDRKSSGVDRRGLDLLRLSLARRPAEGHPVGAARAHRRRGHRESRVPPRRAPVHPARPDPRSPSATATHEAPSACSKLQWSPPRTPSQRRSGALDRRRPGAGRSASVPSAGCL